MMLPDIFDDAFFSDRWTPWSGFYRTSSAPAKMNTDIRDTGNGYELDMELPGFKKEDVKVQLKDGYLTVSAEKNANNDQKDSSGNYVRRERYSGSYSRSFYVGNKVKPEDIHAKFEDGILKLAVPKEAPKQVEDKTYIDID